MRWPPGSNLGGGGGGDCVVFLDKTLYSHSASLYPGVKMGTGEFFRRAFNASYGVLRDVS